MTQLSLQSIRYNSKNNELSIIDQLRLPHETIYIPIHNVQDGWNAIRLMQVRGAPAIADVAILSLCVDLKAAQPQNIFSYIREQLDYLETSRPTAVNLFEMSAKLRLKLDEWELNQIDNVVEKVVEFGVSYFQKDVEDCLAIGNNGAEWIINQCSKENIKDIHILTHCNTGSLATAHHGTALGIIRSLNNRHCLKKVYCTETRPYNQGSRLTAYELVVDKLPEATLITDSMSAWLMKTLSEKNVPLFIIVGADRIASNGDTANKIGTLNLAILSKYYGAKFIVAAPLTSIDLNIKTGAEIIVEERAGEELTTVSGLHEKSGAIMKVKVAANGINVWNPAFDVTTADLIDAIVTERGVFLKKEGKFDLSEQ